VQGVGRPTKKSIQTGSFLYFSFGNAIFWDSIMSDNINPALTLPDDELVHTDNARLRRRLFHILHKPSPENRIARHVNYVLAALILFNCAAVALETDATLYANFRQFFIILEASSTIIFLIEYILRVWVCVEQRKFSHWLFGRLSYMRQPLPLLDLIVVATFFNPVDLRFLRIFRVSRLLRVMNLGNFDHSLQAIMRSIAQRRTMLLVAVGMMMMIAIYLAASVLYIAEHKAQPDKFASIPGTRWWAVMTLTTIGYGDIIPITPLGKFFASVISILGIGIFALPSAILTTAIIEGTQKNAQHSEKCPHCGKHPGE
jgi:voltage-gated potassium channel